MVKKKELELWKKATIIIGILLVLSVYANYLSGSFISSASAAEKAITVINEQLLQSGLEAQLQTVEKQNGVHKITFTVQGQTVTSFISPDGKLLFPSGIELDNVPSTVSQTRVDVSVDDDPVKGNPDAPVTIVEFSDFQCPFCKKTFQEVLPQLQKEYIDTGKVQLVYRDFPLNEIHPHAQLAAEAAECADDQGMFWQYHDVLFNNQQQLGPTSLKSYAVNLDLDVETFNTCLDSRKYQQEVLKDLEEGVSYGVRGTPAIFINGLFINGAQPYAAYKQVIEAELQKDQ